jgi:hypothetical protein
MHLPLVRFRSWSGSEKSSHIAWHNCVQNFLALSKILALKLSRFQEKKGSDIQNAIHKLIELEVLTYYSRRTGQVFWNPVGNFKFHDGISQSGLYSIEVKFDTMAARSLNMCVEVECFGRPSGITTTTAGLWIHVVPIDGSRLCCYEFSTPMLRQRVASLPTYHGGDRGKSCFKLLPISEGEKIKTSKFFLSIDWASLRAYWVER